MPICQNCQQKWSWKETLEKSLTLRPWLICPHCQEKQYVTARTRRRALLLTLLAPFLLVLNTLVEIPAPLFIIGLLGSLVLTVCLYPFVVELSNQAERPF